LNVPDAVPGFLFVGDQVAEIVAVNE